MQKGGSEKETVQRGEGETYTGTVVYGNLLRRGGHMKGRGFEPTAKCIHTLLHKNTAMKVAAQTFDLSK